MKTTSTNPLSASESRPQLLTRWMRKVQLKLVGSRCGRITLHALVALQTGHFMWHWRGIVRELAPF